MHQGREVMGRLFGTTVLSLLVALGLSAGPAAAASGNLNAFLGGKALDKGDWEPVEDHGAFGVQVDVTPRGWPVALDFGLRFSGDEDEDGPVDITAATSEITAGAKKIWEVGRFFRPYFGAGLALVTAVVEVDTPFGDAEEDDTGLGVYATTGAYVTLARHFNLGADFRYTHARVDIGETVNAGGFHFGLLVGFHW
jgi:hypothetical protein